MKNITLYLIFLLLASCHATPEPCRLPVNTDELFKTYCDILQLKFQNGNGMKCLFTLSPKEFGHSNNHLAKMYDINRSVGQRAWCGEIVSQSTRADGTIIEFMYDLGFKKPPELKKRGFLYITPDGLIKYDPHFRFHPVHFIESSLPELAETGDIAFGDEPDESEAAVRMRAGVMMALARLGLELGDYSASDKYPERAKALKKIHKFWDKQRSNFDVGAPKIAVSNKHLEILTKRYRDNDK